MNKNSYFKFYSVYMNELKKLNVFQFRKLITALVNYADKEEIPENLSNKSYAIFNKIQTVIIAEKQLEELKEQRSNAGKTGSQNRWNNKNKQNHSKNITKKGKTDAITEK